ncbi:MAG: DUF917 domain-containing protein [Anaerovoracaceae bacterium]
MKKLDKQEVIDLLYGCAILGTGGGGSLEKGIAMLEKDFEEGRELYLADLAELPDEEYVATPYGCGAPSASMNTFPELDEAPSVTAFRSLERFMGKKFCAVSSTELGGENTAEALHVAYQLGLPIADSDPAGRSVPELIHSTFFICDKPIYPFSVATNYGDVAVFEKVESDERAELLARAMAIASGNEVLVCDHPMKAREFRECVIPKAISSALEIGRTLRENKEAGKDFASAIAEKMNGKVLFKGAVTAMPWESREGFDFGEIHLEGKDAFEGEKYRLDFKNEIYASYRNDTLDVTVPDLICMIDINGNPLTIPDFETGTEMYVLALPAPDFWKTPKGLEIFGPRHFGIDKDYTPFK